MIRLSDKALKEIYMALGYIEGCIDAILDDVPPGAVDSIREALQEIKRELDDAEAE